MRLVVFEDGSWRDLAPFTDLLPTPALAFGASDLTQRWIEATGASLLAIEARPEAVACWREAPSVERKATGGEDVMVVNAACMPGEGLEAALAAGPRGGIALSGSRMLGARVPLERLKPGLGRGAGFEAFVRGLGLERVEAGTRLIERPWHMILWNPEALAADLMRRVKQRANDGGGDVHASAVLLEPAGVVVERGARVDPLAVLDAREGPVWIERDALVAAHTVVRGPCVVRRGTHLLGGLVGRSSVGPDCRIAGEVEDTIWQGRANKRHHGFVGHSIVGEWSNLGALTTTSDLKNNYGSVRVQTPEGEVDTGSQKIGALVGAHVKTGIGTLLPTGAWIGTGANLFGGGRFAPKHVPAFGWWDGERMDVHRVEPFLKTARIVFARRGCEWREAEEARLRAVFEARMAGARAS